MSECGDSTSLEYNGLVSITGKPNQKPSVKAGIYKDGGKFLAFNRKATESQNEILNKQELQQIMSSKNILFREARDSIFPFERAEVWNFFLIVMLLFLLAESLLGLPVANFSFRPKTTMSFALNSWRIDGGKASLGYSPSSVFPLLLT